MTIRRAEAERKANKRWYAEWFAWRPVIVMSPREVVEAKGGLVRFTPICMYPEGVEVLVDEVGFMPAAGVRVLQRPARCE